jgi:propanediol utilization protein
MLKVPIEVSAHHAHISKEDLEILFGGGYELKMVKDLSQKGQFAAQESVDVKTRKGELKKLRILGPVRGMTQVEMSRTDAYILGIDPPIKEPETT